MLTEMIVEIDNKIEFETVVLSNEYMARASPGRAKNSTEFYSIDTANGFRLRGYAPPADWSKALATLTYALRTSYQGPPLSSRRLTVKVKDEQQFSLPSELIILPADGVGVPWIDLNGDKLGSDILELQQVVYVEQTSKVAVAPNLAIRGMPITANLVSARVAIQRAQDYPLEIITCDTALQATYGITGTLDRGGAAINFAGTATSRQYAELLATCTYENNAGE